MLYKALLDLLMVSTMVSNDLDKERRSSSPPIQEEPISLKLPIILKIYALLSIVATVIINTNKISLEKQTHGIMESLRNEKCKTNV